MPAPQPSHPFDVEDARANVGLPPVNDPDKDSEFSDSLEHFGNESDVVEESLEVRDVDHVVVLYASSDADGAAVNLSPFIRACGSNEPP